MSVIPAVGVDTSGTTCPPPNSAGFGLPQYFFINDQGLCQAQSSYFDGQPAMSQAVGYAVVLGWGAFFAIVTSWMVWMEKRYVGTKQSSEWFNTAGRNVKTGMIASVIVSMWTWAATLLQSSNVAWQYGVSGPFWYASGATIQVLLFGVIAIEIKRKAPNAHTVCEIIRARWGKTAHIVFLVFCFLTNIIVTAMLLLGGSAVTFALTGMNIYAASFLIPIGILVYTLAGGLQATFLASYINSFITHVVLCIFIYLVYCGAQNFGLGSIQAVYDKLIFATSADRDCALMASNQQCGPVSGNQGGSFLTMMSLGGFIFGVINIIGNFGTVFVDNSYWMAAIAAKPSATHKGYLLGGLIWFSIPFALGTSLGLATIALGLPITATEAGLGLVPPAAANTLMGVAGGVLILTMLFMAVTSSGCSELLAVSTLITYDIYRPYFNPKADGKQILLVSRICVLAFGLFMGVLAVLLNLANVSLGWVYLGMGVIIGSAVIPVASSILWKQANGSGAIAGACIGLCLGLTAWLSTAKGMYGDVTLSTTGKDVPMLVGNLVSILSSGAIHITWSLIDPMNFDYQATRDITMVDADGQDEVEEEEYSEAQLAASYKWIVIWGCAWTGLVVVVWPLLALPAGVFSLGYFSFWVIISLIWGTIGSAIIIILPIYESWDTIKACCEGMFSNDMLYERMDEINLKVDAILSTMPDAQERYKYQKAKLDALRKEGISAPALEHMELEHGLEHANSISEVRKPLADPAVVSIEV